MACQPVLSQFYWETISLLIATLRHGYGYNLLCSPVEISEDAPEKICGKSISIPWRKASNSSVMPTRR